MMIDIKENVSEQRADNYTSVSVFIVTLSEFVHALQLFVGPFMSFFFYILNYSY